MISASEEKGVNVMAERLVKCLCGNGNKCQMTACKKFQKVNGELIKKFAYKRVKISDDVGRVVDTKTWSIVEKKGKVQPFQPGVEILNIGKKWYLKYDEDENRCTGGFPTKSKAIEWWVNGGR
jgi:hypothetical protein